MASPDRINPAGPSGHGQGPRAPGWYPDPDRFDILRYWDGDRWTSRQRPCPDWVSHGSSLIVAEGQAMIEGPARASELEGPSLATAPTRESPAGHGRPGAPEIDPPPDTDGPGVMPSGNGGGTGGGRGGGGGGGGAGGSSPGDGDHTPATRSRRKWMFFAGVAVLAAVAVGMSGEAMRPKGPGPRVLTDRAYVKAANADCASALPGLRPQDSGPFGQLDTPAQTAAQIERASVGLDSLADRLGALPGAAADRPHVAGWLAGWHGYAALGRQYAAFLRQHGEASPVNLKDAIVRAASTADNFALANGLTQCTLFATPQPDPSNGF